LAQLNSKMRKFLFILLIFGAHQAFSQFEVGLELQVYPTGLIPGIHLEYELSPMSFLHIQVYRVEWVTM